MLAAGVTLSRGGIPAPIVHDEFSYLLAADTFAHGRLGNPAHPFGVFFESFHILQWPRYASKYPPAQGAILALGQVITGRPIVGVWLSYGLMCAALTWMLVAWVPVRWAAGGGLVVAVYLLAFQSGSWAASYWGGAVAATGGALLFGGLKRVLDRPSRPSALPAALMALGVGILANSRPFEGLLVAIPPGLFLLAWLWSGQIGRAARMIRVGGTVVLVLGSFALFMGIYNARVTGSPWKLPYMAYEETYGSRSHFFLGGSREVTFHHQVMKGFYDPPEHTAPQTLSSVVLSIQRKVDAYRGLFFPVFASVLVLLLPWVLCDTKLRVAGASVGLAGAGLLGEAWALGHYASPLLAPLLLLYTAAARRLAKLRLGRAPIGRHLLGLVLAGTLLLALVRPIERATRNATFQGEWYAERARIERRFETTGAGHLILVDYGPSHNPAFEWVYNHADIDASPVVWARSMGVEEDARLIRYYSGRKIWALHVLDDDGPFELQPLRNPGPP